MNLPRYAIIVAGGSGVRMGASLPKQFLPINGLPIVMHTLSNFEKSETFIELVLVLPANQFSTWEELCRKHSFNIKHLLVEGGETRFHSVLNGLNAIGNTGLVAIHDGVRPLVNPELIDRCFETAAEFGSAVPALKPNESVRTGNLTENLSANRDNVWLVQTPQTFKVETIKECYKTPWQSAFTDDASVVEWNGLKITMIEGSPENIKITKPIDLIWAETILKSR